MALTHVVAAGARILRRTTPPSRAAVETFFTARFMKSGIVDDTALNATSVNPELVEGKVPVFLNAPDGTAVAIPNAVRKMIQAPPFTLNGIESLFLVPTEGKLQGADYLFAARTGGYQTRFFVPGSNKELARLMYNTSWVAPPAQKPRLRLGK